MHDADRPWLGIHRGHAPLLLSIPHAGTDLPDAGASGLRSAWLARVDTDWYLPRLYGFAKELDATIIRTEISRTVIDANRDPSGASLYPGMTTTALCPTETFDGEPLYQAGCEPEQEEIESRRRAFHAPYHEAIANELARLRREHAHVVIYDAHSIRSHVPRLFDGELPHLNVGTNSGLSCDRELTRQVVEKICEGPFTHVVNGRFKGGYITRHWGRPDQGIHAIQMEIACRAYLEEGNTSPAPDNWPPAFVPDFAAPLQSRLRSILDACIAFAREHSAQAG